MVYAGCATAFARDIGDVRTIGNAFIVALSIIQVFRKNIKFSRSYWRVILTILLYCAITSIYYGVFNLYLPTTLFIYYTVGYILIKTFESKLFVAYESIMYFLCCIGLIFWAVNICFPIALNEFAEIVHFSKPYGLAMNAEYCNVQYNLLVYTIGSGVFDDAYSFTRLTPLRNCGFCWEPGAFASYITLAIACNLIRNKSIIFKNNKYLLIFLLSLVSTESTTGASILVVMLWLCVLLSKNKKDMWLYFAIAAALTAFFALESFGLEKLASQGESIDIYTKMDSINDADWYAIDRFNSFLIQWNEFCLHPILGLGSNVNETWFQQQGYVNIGLISGIGYLLAHYGAIMVLLYFAMIIRSAVTINRQFNTKFGFLLLVFFIGMLISYSLFNQPILIAFMMYGVWQSNVKSGCPHL